MNNTLRNLKLRREYFLCIIMVVAYVIQFVIFPLCFPKYFPNSNESAWMYWGTLFLVTLLGGTLVSGNIRNWVIPDIIFLMLICLYNSNGAYGTRTYSKLRSVLIELVINAVSILFFQVVILGVVFGVKKIRKLCKKAA